MLKINRIMKPFLVSYLCISISLVLFMVPFTLITQSKINAQNKEISRHALSESKRIIEESIDESVSAISDISGNDLLKELLVDISDGELNYYSTVGFSGYINEMLAKSNKLSNLSVYVKEKNFFITKNGILTPPEYFNIYYNNYSDYKKWYDLINCTNDINIYSDKDSKSLSRIFYKKDLINKVFVPIPITVIAEINETSIKKGIEDIAQYTESYISVSIPASKQEFFSTNSGEVFFTNENKQARLVTFKEKSKKYGIEFVMQIEKSKHMRFAYLMWLLFLVSIIISLIVSLFYGIKKTNKVLSPLTEIIESNEFKDFRGRNSEELLDFNWMKLYVNKLIKQKKSESVKRQFYSIINGDSGNDAYSELEKYFDNKTYKIFVVKIYENDLEKLRTQKYKTEDVNTIMINIIEELIQEKYSVISEKVNENYCYLLSSNNFSDEILSEVFSNIKKQLSNYFGINIYIGVGETIAEVREITKSYKGAIEALWLSQNYKEGQTVFIDKSSENYLIEETNLINDIIWAMEESDVQRTYTIISEFFETIQNNSIIEKRIIKKLHALLTNLLERIIVVEEELVKLKRELDTCFSYVDEIEELQVKICQLFVKLSSERAGKVSRETLVMKFIEDNYSNPNLSVSMIAKVFNLHPVYLAKIFKETNNMGVLEYINKVRFEKAKVMLIETSMKIEDIAKTCGYTSIHTFSRAFKKNVGMAPGALRNKYRG